MNKICSSCKKEKDEASFNFRHKERGIRLTYCSECGKIKTRNHYTNNKDYYKGKARKRRNIKLIDNRVKLFEYLKENPCVDCGEADPIVLEFDHVKGIKYKNIALLMSGGCNWELIAKEIEKCEVRCANCHRRKTAKQFDYYSYLGV